MEGSVVGSPYFPLYTIFISLPNETFIQLILNRYPNCESFECQHLNSRQSQSAILIRITDYSQRPGLLNDVKNVTG